MSAPAAKRSQGAALRLYGDAVRLWLAGFDTWSIAARLGVPGSVTARWVANFREMTRAP